METVSEILSKRFHLFVYNLNLHREMKIIEIWYRNMNSRFDDLRNKSAIEAKLHIILDFIPLDTSLTKFMLSQGL